MQDLRLIDFELSCAAGVNREAIQTALRERRSGLSPNTLAHSSLDTPIGRVSALDELNTSDVLQQWQSRNNALALLCLRQERFADSCQALIKAHGADRIGIVVGSSTSSIDRTEAAFRQTAADAERFDEEYRQPWIHNPHAPAMFTAHTLGISGPAITVSTACSSSAKVFATASRWLHSDLVDAVIVGGVDSLCLSVLHGFHSLQLVSNTPCRPYDAGRDGINLGEAAGFAIVGHAKNAPKESVRLRAYGESSDAHHMSHPHPEGLGAELAIRQALQRAGMDSNAIDYVSLHGTASQANDLIEGQVMARVFPEHTLASSTKGWTGHTLGAAGIVEAILACETLLGGVIPGTLHLEQHDPDIPFKVMNDNSEQQAQTVMSNSFGFGGNNSSLIFSVASA